MFYVLEVNFKHMHIPDTVFEEVQIRASSTKQHHPIQGGVWLVFYFFFYVHPFYKWNGYLFNVVMWVSFFNQPFWLFNVLEVNFKHMHIPDTVFEEVQIRVSSTKQHNPIQRGVWLVFYFFFYVHPFYKWNGYLFNVVMWVSFFLINHFDCSMSWRWISSTCIFQIQSLKRFKLGHLQQSNIILFKGVPDEPTRLFNLLY